MTTQNHTTTLIANAAITLANFPEGGGLNIGAGPAYYPSFAAASVPLTGLHMDGYDHVGFTGTLIVGANNNITLTFEGSNDGTLWRDITLSGWNTATGAFGTASFATGVGPATVYFSMDFDYYDYKYIRAKITVAAGGGDCSANIVAKRRKE